MNKYLVGICEFSFVGLSLWFLAETVKLAHQHMRFLFYIVSMYKLPAPIPLMYWKHYETAFKATESKENKYIQEIVLKKQFWL